MSLSKDQQDFARCVGKLLNFIYMPKVEQGWAMPTYAVTFGDAYRDPRVFGYMGEKKAYGNKSSNHKKRLAIDLNLFINGNYVKSSEDYKPLAQYWEQIGVEESLPLRSGYRYNDANHFEFAPKWVKVDSI